MAMEEKRASKGVGVGEKFLTGNIHNVSLADPRIKLAGIDPNSLLGKGISETELQKRLKKVRGR